MILQESMSNWTCKEKRQYDRVQGRNTAKLPSGLGFITSIVPLVDKYNEWCKTGMYGNLDRSVPNTNYQVRRQL